MITTIITTTRGHRLVAQGRLPIHPEDTLILGSRDSGQTLRTLQSALTSPSRDILEAQIAAIGTALNLKRHVVRANDGTKCAMYGLSPHPISRHLSYIHNS